MSALERIVEVVPSLIAIAATFLAVAVIIG